MAIVMNRISLSIAALFLVFGCASPVRAEAPWEWRPNTLELHGKDIKFEWAVPKLVRTPGDTAQWQKLLDKRMKSQLSEFQSAFEDAQKENAKLQKEMPDFHPNPWESSGGYQVVWQDPDHLVLLWQGYDYRGGAHGLPMMEVTVLSAEQPDSLLPPSSLFNDEEKVLQALSTSSRAGLASQFADGLDEWALQGTEPTWDNFALVYPTQVDGPARFEVIFPSYQVAPYSAGTPTVEIPWDILAPYAPSLKDGVALP